MNCKQCSEHLVDYSRDELPPDVRWTIAGHLSTCDLCRMELARLQQLDTLLDRTEQPSHELQSKFAARLAAEIKRPRDIPAPRPRTGLFEAIWPSRPLAAMCYSFALLACGLVSGQLLPPATLGFTSDFADQDGQRNIPQICSVPVPPNNEVL